MCSGAVFELGLKGGETARIEEAIIIDDRPEEKRMGDGRVKSSIRCWLNVLIGLFGRFVKEKNIVGLESHDGEFLAICSIAHLRIY